MDRPDLRRRSARATRTARERSQRRGPATSCPRCHREPAVDVHELARRSQSPAAALDVFVQLPLGRACHDWVGLHPAAAVEQGWAVWGWQYRAQLRTLAEASYVTAADAVASDAMPRPASGRRPFTVKLSDAGRAAITQRVIEAHAAGQTDMDESEMARQMLSYAEQRMPRPRAARPQPKEHTP